MARDLSSAVLLGMSGGYASTVAAAILKQQGLEVFGVYLDYTSQARVTGGRCQQDLENRKKRAKEFSSALEIPLEILAVGELFEAEVADRVVHEVLQLRRPSPCRTCRARVLIPSLLSLADTRGIPTVVTGHFAQILHDPSSKHRPLLVQGIDPEWDQSSELALLEESALLRLRLPLGELHPRFVAKLAQELGLAGTFPGTDLLAALKPKACFSDRARLCREIRENATPPGWTQPGSILDHFNQVQGHHTGLDQFQIGDPDPTQQENRDPNEPARVVIGFRPLTSNLIVGQMESLTVCEFEIAELKWVRPPPKWKGLKVEVRWGARSSEKPPTAKILQFFGGVVHARFEEPQGLVQIGDEVTFLQGQEVLGVGRVRRLGTQDGFTSYDEVKAHDLHD